MFLTILTLLSLRVINPSLAQYVTLSLPSSSVAGEQVQVSWSRTSLAYEFGVYSVPVQSVDAAHATLLQTIQTTVTDSMGGSFPAVYNTAGEFVVYAIEISSGGSEDFTLDPSRLMAKSDPIVVGGSDSPSRSSASPQVSSGTTAAQSSQQTTTTTTSSQSTASASGSSESTSGKSTSESATLTGTPSSADGSTVVQPKSSVSSSTSTVSSDTDIPAPSNSPVQNSADTRKRRALITVLALILPLAVCGIVILVMIHSIKRRKKMEWKKTLVEPYQERSNTSTGSSFTGTLLRSSTPSTSLKAGIESRKEDAQSKFWPSMKKTKLLPVQNPEYTRVEVTESAVLTPLSYFPDTPSNTPDTGLAPWRVSSHLIRSTTPRQLEILNQAQDLVNEIEQSQLSTHPNVNGEASSSTSPSTSRRREMAQMERLFAEIDKMRSEITWLKKQYDSDWALGLTDELPPDYRSFVGRRTSFGM